MVWCAHSVRKDIVRVALVDDSSGSKILGSYSLSSRAFRDLYFLLGDRVAVFSRDGSVFLKNGPEGVRFKFRSKADAQENFAVFGRVLVPYLDCLGRNDCPVSNDDAAKIFGALVGALDSFIGSSFGVVYGFKGSKDPRGVS